MRNPSQKEKKIALVFGRVLFFATVVYTGYRWPYPTFAYLGAIACVHLEGINTSLKKETRDGPV